MREKLNCPNCGAPIDDFKCPYCGTVFYDFVNVDREKPIYLRVKLADGSIVLCSTLLNNLTITHNLIGMDVSSYRNKDEISILPSYDVATIGLELAIVPNETDRELYKIIKRKEKEEC